MRADRMPTTFEGAVDHVMEEAAEFIKAVMKRKRFGDEAVDPLTGVKYDNFADLMEEASDILIAAGELFRLLPDRKPFVVDNNPLGWSADHAENMRRIEGGE